MSVTVELEPEGAPGRDTEIAEAELFIDEIKVVMEALAGIMLEKGVPRLLVAMAYSSCMIPWPRRYGQGQGGFPAPQLPISLPLPR